MRPKGSDLARFRRKVLQGIGQTLVLWTFAARLKSCPDTKPLRSEFSWELRNRALALTYCGRCGSPDPGPAPLAASAPRKGG